MTGLKLRKTEAHGWIRPCRIATSKQVERKADLKLDRRHSEGKLTVTYYGSRPNVANGRSGEDATSRKKIFEDMVRESVPGAIDVELQNQPDWKSSSPALLKASIRSRCRVGWRALAKRALLPVGLFSSPEKNVFEHRDECTRFISIIHTARLMTSRSNCRSAGSWDHWQNRWSRMPRPRPIP